MIPTNPLNAIIAIAIVWTMTLLVIGLIYLDSRFESKKDRKDEEKDEHRKFWNYKR